MKQTVLHVLAPMREGGLERVVTMLATAQLENRDVRVAAVVGPGTENNHPFIERLEAAGVPVARIVVDGRSYLTEYLQIRELIRQYSPSIVHTHGYRADIIAGTAARREHAKTVSTLHGFTGGDIRNRFYEWLQCLAVKRADAVIAVSTPIVDRLLAAGIFGAKVQRIQNGFTPTTNRLARDTARRRLGLEPKQNVIGWVGRLSREKGADVMLGALAESNSNWRLSLIGDGADDQALRQQAAGIGISDRVTWHGSVPNAAEVMPAFDAFVLSSRTEGTPISLFEAMDARIPVVATKVGGVPDVITSDEAILVPAENPAAIARALDEIARDPLSAAERANRARQKLLGTFSLSAWVAAVDKVYENAAGISRAT